MLGWYSNVNESHDCNMAIWLVIDLYPRQLFTSPQPVFTYPGYWEVIKVESIDLKEN